MTPDWICFVVSQNFIHRSRNSVDSEMRRVFGKDFLDFTITHFQADNVYAFVRVRNYDRHLDAFRNSPSVSSVLNSLEHPSLLSDSEVKAFVESATPVSGEREYHPGDIVRIISGCYSSLIGVVTGQITNGRYRVLLKFHIRNFTERFKTQELEYIINIFSIRKTPALCQKDVVSATVLHHIEVCSDERSGHRSKRRKSGKQKK